MDRRKTWIWLLAAGVLGALAVGQVSTAGAQYPPPVGAVEVAAEQETAVLGESVGVSATVLDQNGEPAAGVECTFAIAEQPGSDASVDAGPATTDSAGVASTTLDVGSTAGTITVEAACGELTARVSVVAGAATAPATPAAAAPPASLPSTGSSEPAVGGDAMALAALIASGVALAMAAAALSWRRARKS